MRQMASSPPRTCRRVLPPIDPGSPSVLEVEQLNVFASWTVASVESLTTAHGERADPDIRITRWNSMPAKKREFIVCLLVDKRVQFSVVRPSHGYLRLRNSLELKCFFCPQFIGKYHDVRFLTSTTSKKRHLLEHLFIHPIHFKNTDNFLRNQSK